MALAGCLRVVKVRAEHCAGHSAQSHAFCLEAFGDFQIVICVFSDTL